MTKRKHHAELLSKIEERLAPDRSYNARKVMFKPPKNRITNADRVLELEDLPSLKETPYES